MITMSRALSYGNEGNAAERMVTAQRQAHVIEQAGFSGGRGNNVLSPWLNLKTACAILFRQTDRPPTYTL
jgi:hypothetical protein